MTKLHSSLAVLLAAVVLALTCAAPASATTYSSTNTTITGLPALGTAYIHQGDIVALWQNILYTDYKADECLTTNANAIDGYFGAMTKADTISWQTDNGLSADGIVGAQTWSKVWSKTQSLGYEPNWATYDWAYLGRRLGSGSHYLDLARFTSGSMKTAYAGRWAFNNLANPNGNDSLIQWTALTIYTC